MNRLGAALLGEVSDPPIQSLFVFCANPVTSSAQRRPDHRRACSATTSSPSSTNCS